MTTSGKRGSTAIVTGAGRGFGRAIAAALHASGAEVVAVARNTQELATLRNEMGDGLTTAAADAADAVVAGTLIDEHEPDVLVLNAGAAPLLRPLQHHTWESFERNWHVDVRHAFHWVREALLLPLRPGSTVITMSSGAALAGSPLSGGYAGAKATIRFISVLPRLTPVTGLGSAAVAAYAARDHLDVDTYLERFGPVLSVDQVGKAALELVNSPEHKSGSYLLTAAGLTPVG